MVATLPQFHLRRRLLPGPAVVSRLQNPTAGPHPVLPPPAPPPSAALLAAEGTSLAPRREHRFPGSVASRRPADGELAASEAAADDAVLRRALEVRRAVAA